MTTNKIDKKTKEGFAVWAKTENNEVYHFVQREERFAWYSENEGVTVIEETLLKKGIVTVKVQLTWRSDFSHGIGSCRLDNQNTEDPAGLAYKKAVDNGLQILGVGVILEDGQPVSSLNRNLTPGEVVEKAMASELP